MKYRIAVEEDSADTVFAELRYQPLSYGHLQDLFLLSGKIDTVDMFCTIHESTELHDEMIDSATIVVP